MASVGYVQKAVEYAKDLFDPDKKFLTVSRLHGFYPDMDDALYLKKLYKAKMGRDLDLKNPDTFNAKLQWLKLYDRKEIYTTLVDKYKVKDYVAEKIGPEYIIPTLGAWESFDDIDFSALPDQFVLKCNHDSGGLVIVRDKAAFGTSKKKMAKKKLERSLHKNFYTWSREWPYKNVKPLILAETYMEQDSVPDSIQQDLSNGSNLVDYKLMCFNGKVKCSFTTVNRWAKSGVEMTFYDREWKRLPFERHFKSSKEDVPKPAAYEEMVMLAEKLAEDIPFCRIDFYEVNGRPYFGEITLYPGSGFEEFTPEEWDGILGSWLTLPEKKIRRK